MKCEQVQACFDRMYREGDRFGQKEVIRHLSGCTVCRREFDRWRIIAGELGTVPRQDAPRDLYLKVIREVDALKRNTAEKRNRRFRIPSWRWYPVPVALCAVLLMTITGRVIVRHDKKATVTVAEQVKPPDDGTVTAHFRFSCDNARRVAVVGDFNGWDTGKDQLVKGGNGTWGADIQVGKGCYQYLFLVDGTEWRLDPAAAVQVPDGFGGFNMVIEL